MRVDTTKKDLVLTFSGHIECVFTWKKIPLQTRLLLITILDRLLVERKSSRELASLVAELNTHPAMRVALIGDDLKITCPQMDNLRVVLTDEEMEILRDKLNSTLDTMNVFPLELETYLIDTKYPADRYRDCTIRGTINCGCLKLLDVRFDTCHITADIVDLKLRNLPVNVGEAGPSSISCKIFTGDSNFMRQYDHNPVRLDIGVAIIGHSGINHYPITKYLALLTSCQVVVVTCAHIGVNLNTQQLQIYLEGFNETARKLGNYLKTWQLVIKFGATEHHHHWDGDKFSLITKDSILNHGEYLYLGAKKHHDLYRDRGNFRYLALINPKHLDNFPTYHCRLIKSGKCHLAINTSMPKSARSAI